MDALEKLAVYTAMEKQLKEIRDDIRDDVSDLFADNPMVDRLNLTVGDKKVGTASRINSKPDYRIVDQELFDDFALSYGFARYKYTIKPSWMAEAVAIMRDLHPEAVEETVVVDDNWKDFMNHVDDVVTYFSTSEIVPGVEYVPSHPTDRFVVKGCKWEDVRPQLGSSLSSLLLGAPDEG